MFCGERTGIDVGIGVLVSGAFAAFYSGISPYNSAFDLIAMRPTQYMIMVTIACGVAKEFAGSDNYLTDVVVTVLIIGLCSPLLLFLIVRLLKPDYADRVVQRLYLLRYHHTIRTYSKTQSVIAKSSGESELYAVVRASAEGPAGGGCDGGVELQSRVSCE